LGVGSWELGVGSWELGVGSWELVVGRWSLVVGRWSFGCWEYRKFFGYSIRSLAGVVRCLYKAKFRNYISESDFKRKYSDSFNRMNMMIAFRANINNKN
jgi:hypothetical protein